MLNYSVVSYLVQYFVSLCKESMHSSLEQLSHSIHSAGQHVVVGSTYYHYKNSSHHYRVIAVALEESSEQIVVVYKSLYGSGIVWTRPLSSWIELVELNGSSIPRFQSTLKS